MALGRPEYEDTKNQMATKQQNQNPNRLNMHSQSFSLCAFACVTFFLPLLFQFYITFFYLSCVNISKNIHSIHIEWCDKLINLVHACVRFIILPNISKQKRN